MKIFAIFIVNLYKNLMKILVKLMWKTGDTRTCIPRFIKCTGYNKSFAKISQQKLTA